MSNADPISKMFECGLMYVQTKVSVLHGLDDRSKPVLDFIRGLEYNGFDGTKVAPCIERMVNGGVVSEFRFGREYSPVLYLTVNPFKLDITKAEAEGRGAAFRSAEIEANSELMHRTRAALMYLRTECEPDELWGTPPKSGNVYTKYLDKDGKWVAHSSQKKKVANKERVLIERGEIRAWWD